MFDRVTDGIVALDRDWIYRYINPAAERSLQVPVGSLLGQHIWTRFPEGIGLPFHRAYERAMHEQVFIELEDYYPPLDRWFENRIYPGADGITIYFHDVTERKKAEMALRAAADRSAFLADVLARLTVQPNLRAVFQELCRIPIPALGDAVIAECITPEGERFRMTACRDASGQAGEASELPPPEHEFAWPAGTSDAPQGGISTLPATWSDPLVDAACAAVPSGLRLLVPLHAGVHAIGHLVVVRDVKRPGITAPELELLHDFADRAALVLERIRLHHITRQALEAREQFLSIASHELKTPITSLLLALQTIDRAGPGSERFGEMMATAIRQTSRLSRLVKTLLDVTRIQAGRLALDRTRFDMGELVRRMAGSLVASGECSRDAISVEVRGATVGVWDHDRIEQVLSNLLSNAIKYGAGRPIAVHVDGRGELVELTVVDHGIGIAAERLAHIFDRFERAVSEREYGGLGLGLFIASQIVLAHGGEIAAESAKGETRFRVRLPRS